MKKQLVKILVEELKLDPGQAILIVDRVLLFLDRNKASRNIIEIPKEDIQRTMLAVRAYKERLELQVSNAPHVGSNEIQEVQDMRNLEFTLQNYIFAQD